jgi:hypothetical protein
MALVVVKAQPPVAELLTKQRLVREVVDDFFLLVVQVATSEGDQ